MWFPNLFSLCMVINPMQKSKTSWTKIKDFITIALSDTSLHTLYCTCDSYENSFLQYSLPFILEDWQFSDSKHINAEPLNLKTIMLASSQQPYPKGEVFIGHRDGDFSVSMGCSDNCNTQGYVFTLHTPERDFILSAETREDMNQWICALQRVTDLPMTPQDNRRKYICLSVYPNSSSKLQPTF